MAAPVRKCVVGILQNKHVLTKQFAISRGFRCSTFLLKKDVDPEQVFIRKDIQDALKRITGFELDKIFRVKATPTYKTPKYKLATASELKQIEESMYDKAQKKLQMPPYLIGKEEEEVVISDEPKIAGLISKDLVFTDISRNVSNQDRLIVVRERNGRLRKANQAERIRILHVYYPQKGKMYHVPEMFEEENLERLLAEKSYEYILDRACVQFEPYEPKYLQITHRTYECINSDHEYDTLRSTRHFGPMSFYLAHYKKIDGLLVDMIQRDLLTDAVDLIRIFHALHPDCKSLEASQDIQNPLEFVQCYATKDSTKSGMIELAIQTYSESQQTKNQATQ